MNVLCTASYLLLLPQSNSFFYSVRPLITCSAIRDGTWRAVKQDTIQLDKNGRNGNDVTSHEGRNRSDKLGVCGYGNHVTKI